MLVAMHRGHRRRVIVAILIVACLALITISAREGTGGMSARVDGTTSSLAAPAASVVTRITRPFADAYSWLTGLIDAESQAGKYHQLELEYTALRAHSAASDFQLRQLQAAMGFKNASRFSVVGASVALRDPDSFASQVVIDRGTSSGITAGDAVVAPLVARGSSSQRAENGALVGVVQSGCSSTTCPVRLITDQSSGDGYSAQVVGTNSAQGLLLPLSGTDNIFSLDLIPISIHVPKDGVVATAGIGTSRLKSVIPAGIPIGKVQSVSESDGSPYDVITVAPFADFQALSDLLVIKSG